MKENSIEEDIKILENMNDGYTFKDCDMCNNYNEKTKCCDKHKCMELQAIERVLLDYKRVLKENEELKDIDLTTVHIKGVCDEKDRWRNKIRELILNKKQKIQENSKEIEECRKTIMEEQELKKLKLYTLHKNNDLLELEIADLFNLLKEE